MIGRCDASRAGHPRFGAAVLLLAVLRMLGRGKLKERGMLAAFRMSRRL